MLLDVVSHIVLDDKFFFNEKQSIINKVHDELGGPVSYVYTVSDLFPMRYNLITSYGPDMPYLEFFSSQKNVSLVSQISPSTTRFVHYIYPNFREMYVRSVAQNLDSTVLSLEERGDACLISPVLNEISLAALKKIRDFYPLIGVDIQGFLRMLDDQQKVIFRSSSAEVAWLLENVEILKFSLREARKFTNKPNIPEIFQAISSKGLIIITAGKDGVYYSLEGSIFHFPAIEKQELDPTGAGDVFMGGLISSYLLDKDPETAIAVGMVLAAERVSKRGIQLLPKKDYSSEIKWVLEQKEEL